jgi:hypothetical protein
VKEFRLRMAGKEDRNGEVYYYTTTAVPVSLDLDNAVMHIYPFEEGESFGAEFVFRKYDPTLKDSYRADNGTKRRRRYTKDQDTDVDVNYEE